MKVTTSAIPAVVANPAAQASSGMDTPITTMDPAQVEQTLRSITGCSWDAQFGRSLFEEDSKRFLEANRPAIRRQGEAFADDQGGKDTFFTYAFPLVCELAREHGFEPFIEIARAKPGEAWAICETIHELGDLVGRTGMDPLVELTKQYERAVSILCAIRGESIGSMSTTECRYEHSMVPNINSPEDLHAYAAKLDYFLSTVEEALPHTDSAPERLVATYGIDSLRVIAKLAVLKGERAMEKFGRGLNIKSEMDQLEPMIEAFGYESMEQLIDEIGEYVCGFTKSFPRMHDRYTSFETYRTAVSHVMTMVEQRGGLSSLYRKRIIRDLLKALFHEDRNLRLVDNLGLDAFAEALAYREETSIGWYGDILAEVAHLISSRKDLARFTRSILDTGHHDRQHVVECLQHIPHLITSYEHFSCAIDTLDEFRHLFGGARITWILGEKGAAIQSTEELALAPFVHDENRELVKRYGLTALTMAIPREGHIHILDRLAQFSHLVGNYADLDRLIGILVGMNAKQVLPALKHVGHLVNSFDRLTELGEAMGALCDECPVYASKTLPAMRSLLVTLDDFYDYADAAIIVARVAEKYKPGGAKYVFNSLVGILEREIIATPDDFELYGLEVANIGKHGSDRKSSQAIREEDKIDDQEQMLYEMKRTARLLNRIRSHLHMKLKEDDELKRRAFEANFNYFTDDLFIPTADSRGRLEEITAGLARHGITQPLRFNTMTAREVIRNRNHIDQPDGRPLALAVYPTSDWNTAFECNQIMQLIELGYRFVYFEAEKSSDFRNAVLRTSRVQQISLLVIAGHGFLTHLNFGLEDKTNVKEGERDYYLDISRPHILDGLAAYLAPNSVVVLHSCSTGAGCGRLFNLANMVGRAFPHSTTIAATIPTNVDRYVDDGHGRVIDVEFWGPEDSYIIRPA